MLIHWQFNESFNFDESISVKIIIKHTQKTNKHFDKRLMQGQLSPFYCKGLND